MPAPIVIAGYAALTLFAGAGAAAVVIGVPKALETYAGEAGKGSADAIRIAAVGAVVVIGYTYISKG